MAAPLTLAGYANQIANLVGLREWDLFQANYNGCSFMTMAPTALESLNPAQGIINLSRTAGSFGGYTKANDPNSGLFATTMHMLQSRDSIKRKIVRHSIPHSNVDIIDDFGWGGFSFKMNAIFNGTQYLMALDNFIQRVVNENNPNVKTIIGSKYHQLLHPVMGIMNDVYLSEINIIHESKVFKGVTLELQFESTNSGYINTNLTDISNIGKYFDAIQIAIASLAQTISLIKLVAQ